MQLFSPSNILFFLLFAFFARSAPIGAGKSKEDLINNGAFLDVDSDTESVHEKKPVQSFNTKKIKPQNAPPPARNLPPIPPTGPKSLSKAEMAEAHKKIAELPENDWSRIGTLRPPPKGSLPPLPPIKAAPPIPPKSNKRQVLTKAPSEEKNPTESPIGKALVAPMHQVKDEDFTKVPRVAPKPPPPPQAPPPQKPSRGERLKSLMKGKFTKFKAATGH